MAKKNKKEKDNKEEIPAEKMEEEVAGKINLSTDIEEIQEAPKDPLNLVVQKNCECKKIGRYWYCMKQDNMGHMVLCDGPFKTKTECDELAVCDE